MARSGIEPNSKPLFHLELAGLSMEYSPTRDGLRFIAIAMGEDSSQTLTLVQNWTSDLRVY